MSNLKCPWCKEKIEEPDSECFGGDGSTHETECSHCEKTIEFTMQISVDYDVAAIGCEKHLLIGGDMFWIYKENIATGKDFGMKCKHCSYEVYSWQLPGGQYPKLKSGQFEFTDELIEIAKQRGWAQ